MSQSMLQINGYKGGSGMARKMSIPKVVISPDVSQQISEEFLDENYAIKPEAYLNQNDQHPINDSDSLDSASEQVNADYPSDQVVHEIDGIVNSVIFENKDKQNAIEEEEKSSEDNTKTEEEVNGSEDNEDFVNNNKDDTENGNNMSTDNITDNNAELNGRMQDALLESSKEADNKENINNLEQIDGKPETAKINGNFDQEDIFMSSNLSRSSSILNEDMSIDQSMADAISEDELKTENHEIQKLVAYSPGTEFQFQQNVNEDESQVSINSNQDSVFEGSDDMKYQKEIEATENINPEILIENHILNENLMFDETAKNQIDRTLDEEKGNESSKAPPKLDTYILAMKEKPFDSQSIGQIDVKNESNVLPFPLESLIKARAPSAESDGGQRSEKSFAQVLKKLKSFVTPKPDYYKELNQYRSEKDILISKSKSEKQKRNSQEKVYIEKTGNSEDYQRRKMEQIRSRNVPSFNKSKIIQRNQKNKPKKPQPKISVGIQNDEYTDEIKGINNEESEKFENRIKMKSPNGIIVQKNKTDAVRSNSISPLKKEVTFELAEDDVSVEEESLPNLKNYIKDKTPTPTEEVKIETVNPTINDETQLENDGNSDSEIQNIGNNFTDTYKIKNNFNKSSKNVSIDSINSCSYIN